MNQEQLSNGYDYIFYLHCWWDNRACPSEPRPRRRAASYHAENSRRPQALPPLKTRCPYFWWTQPHHERRLLVGRARKQLRPPRPGGMLCACVETNVVRIIYTYRIRGTNQGAAKVTSILAVLKLTEDRPGTKGRVPSTLSRRGGKSLPPSQQKSLLYTVMTSNSQQVITRALFKYHNSSLRGERNSVTQTRSDVPYYPQNTRVVGGIVTLKLWNTK